MGCKVPWDEQLVEPHELVPTMLRRREIDYLSWLATQVGSLGRVVELGCFLGGSTAALTSGLSRIAHDFSQAPVLVYDSFQAPSEQIFEASPELALFGLEPNKNFRDLFHRLHMSRREKYEMRERLIPESVDGAAADTLYPEQAPIGLLFVDLAKAWGVHLTVMRAFGRHLAPGGVLVQQDFGDFRTPWIVLHMWRLRDQFEVLDRIRDASTVSFRRRDDSPLNLDSLDPSPDTCESEVWDEIAEYWGDLFSRFHSGDGSVQECARGWLAGHRAVHMLHAKRFEEAVESAHAHERWRRTGHSDGVYCAPDWPAWLGDLAGHLRRLGASELVVRSAEGLFAECDARERIPNASVIAGSFKTEALKDRVWCEVKERLIREGTSAVALYGAGRHTRWLLGSGWPGPELAVACVLDDNPGVDSIHGVPVLRAGTLCAHSGLRRLHGLTLLPSSDEYEPEILKRAAPIAEQAGAILRPVYTATDLITTNDIRRGPRTDLTSRSIIMRPNATDLDPAPPHRVDLGLPPHRSWIPDLCKLVGWPHWAKGHINTRDAAFIWDFVEATHAATSIEIGTASGVSTAALAHAINQLVPQSTGDHSGTPVSDQYGVWTFDILDYCYFDFERPVGAAALLIAPDLEHTIHIRTGHTARDASRSFSAQSIHLALIDADHRHPAATLDMLALLPVLAPGGWVLLHDISLDAINEQRAEHEPPSQHALEDGPRRLFEGWTFAKVREKSETPARSNIGAIQIPQDIDAAAAALLDILSE